ncbi:helix-turn-helix domain-containing protein [Enterococcus pallens]|uniref:HTH cro/C1-type domain-containing protein n=1 Tax=Enterococcus pallens ATCC BAA-351 TaxID=1158607 RepID=R2RSC8_9ENTE|nr:MULTISPECIES: helix-turn-helix transcriptional regulator [Enterococcus]EOH86270.1 hypothetical protein UAU_05291 [Enterococcus pallens ATCC BAA-351]EOU09406.1 hypothetical protein I588_05252 [Enterococcus pallens ATCC BAA-351]MBO1340297.1 helix-turn-helix transcriptional regulator [Enterococcus sp. 665A]
MTSSINDLIARKKASSPQFAAEFEKEKQRLNVAVAVAQLRDELGMTQRELAEKVGKPQSTIARIENGSMNVSFNVLYEIATSVGKEVTIGFK